MQTAATLHSYKPLSLGCLLKKSSQNTPIKMKGTTLVKNNNRGSTYWDRWQQTNTAVAQKLSTGILWISVLPIHLYHWRKVSLIFVIRFWGVGWVFCCWGVFWVFLFVCCWGFGVCLFGVFFTVLYVDKVNCIESVTNKVISDSVFLSALLCCISLLVLFTVIIICLPSLMCST